MKFQTFLFLLLLLPVTYVTKAQEYVAGNKGLSLQGYVKVMPAVQADRDFENFEFLNILHNRLNFRWDIIEGLSFFAGGRNRLFYNDMFREFPLYADVLGYDPGLIDMSWIWLNKGSMIGHTNIDRLYLDWRSGDLQVRAGRQRINWGVNLVSNPNDLFNTYSFFDFDYPERPGADALRVQYHTGFASRMEVAWSPSEDSRQSTAAVLWATNIGGNDIQTLAGYYRHRWAAGLGWAGSIGGAGIKGEATWFYDIQKQQGVDRGNLVMAAGLDYMFSNSTFAVIEFLYNGGYGRTQQGVFLITQPLRPDNIMFSEYAITLNAQHPFTTIFQAGMAVMLLPDIEAAFIMPSINYSLVRNLDMEIVAQLFAGGQNSVFRQAGSSLFVSIQYSF